MVRFNGDALHVLILLQNPLARALVRLIRRPMTVLFDQDRRERWIATMTSSTPPTPIRLSTRRRVANGSVYIPPPSPTARRLISGDSLLYIPGLVTTSARMNVTGLMIRPC